MTPELRLEMLTIDLLSAQRKLTDAQRVQLWQKLQKGYCRECGTPDPYCHCTKDE